MQEKFIKNVTGLKGKTYSEKLKEIDMLSLEKRRTYLELVETFKIIRGYTKVDRSKLFELVSDNLRRQTRSSECPVNIVQKRCNLDIRRNFYTARVSSYWNDLPTDLKLTPALGMFKNNLKSYMLDNYSETDD